MKITVISLDKWGYNQFIVDELKSRGIIATHINYHNLKYKYPTVLHKVFNFFSKTLFNYNLKRAYLKKGLFKVLENQDKQDVILVIKGDDLSVSTLKRIKKNTNELIAFFNDSMSRYPRMKTIFPYFDEVYSFEPSDVAKYNFKAISNYIYFDYKNKVKKEVKYGVFNISSLDKRTKVMPDFARYFKDHKIDYKLIAFSNQSHSELSDLNIEVTNRIYGLEDVLKLVNESEYLLDIQRPRQHGLSFRIMEGIALEKKIISTNKDLVNYDFYNPNNIAIVDSNNIHIDNTFFNTPYESIAPEIVKKYHVSSWANEVFNLNKV